MLVVFRPVIAEERDPWLLLANKAQILQLFHSDLFTQPVKVRLDKRHQWAWWNFVTDSVLFCLLKKSHMQPPTVSRFLFETHFWNRFLKCHLYKSSPVYNRRWRGIGRGRCGCDGRGNGGGVWLSCRCLVGPGWLVCSEEVLLGGRAPSCIWLTDQLFVARL